MLRPGATLRRPQYIGDPVRGALARLRARERLRVAVASPWFWLALGTAVVFVAGLVYVLDFETFFVMSDEMTYLKEAVHAFEKPGPLTPDDRYYSSISQLPQLLRAPTLLADGIPQAWDLMRVLNLVAFVSAAVPAYLVARSIIVFRWVAVGAALSCICVPWIVINATLLTDGLSYAAFVWAIAAMHHGLTRPGWRADLLALVTIGVAVAVRPQHIVLFAAYVLAVGVHAIAWRETLRRHALLLVAGVVGLLAVAALGFSEVRDQALGNYSVTGSGSLLPAGMVDVAGELAAVVAIAVGGLPLMFGIAFVVATLWRAPSREQHAFAALALCAGLGTLAVASSFIVRFTAGAGLSERYACYLAPLLLLATGALLTRPRLPVIPLVVGAAGTWWACSVVPTLAESVNLFAPAAPFHRVLNSHLRDVAGAWPFDDQQVMVIALAIVVVGLALAWPRRLVSTRTFASVVGGALLALVVAQTAYTLHATAEANGGAPQRYKAMRDWVDDTVGWDTRVAAVLGELYDAQTSQQAWWEATFWNRSVDFGYALAPSAESFGQERTARLEIDARTGAVSGFAGEQHLLYSSRDQRFRIAGARPVREVGELTLATLPADPHARWWLNGTDSAGRLGPTGQALLRRYGPEAPATLTARRTGAPGPTALVLRAPGWERTVALGAAPVRVPLPAGTAPVRLRVEGGPKSQARIALG